MGETTFPRKAGRGHLFAHETAGEIIDSGGYL